MDKISGKVIRLKRFLSHHPSLCLWVSRLYSLYHGFGAVIRRIPKKMNCYVDRSVKVIGWSHVRIGANSVVAAGSSLIVNSRKGVEPTLIIGDNCFVGCNNFISVGKRVVLGDYCLTATNCAFIGSSHNVNNPYLPYISTGVDEATEIAIGANCFFGYGAKVIGSVSVGHGSVIGAGAVVLKDVPPFSIVIGNPGRVVKRFSHVRNCWLPVAEYIEEPLVSEEEYLSAIRKAVGYYPLPISAARSMMGDV